MAKVPADVVLCIVFPNEKPEETVIYTNAKPTKLEEILETWLLDQVGRGTDGKKLTERPIYTITIGLVLEDDSWCLESDAGNIALTVGIVTEVLHRLPKLTIKDWSERPIQSEKNNG